MKKIILLIIVLLILINCKDSNPQGLNYSLENTIAENTKLTCEDLVYKIVKSSNLELREQKGFLTQIDRIEEDNITIHVYIENNISDDSKTKQIVESTIAWLSLNVNNSQLFNTTADPDNPIELNFDKKILSENDIFSLCQIEKKQKKDVASNQPIKYSTLPIDFDEYYKACVKPYDSIQCNKNYPKYFYKEEDAIVKIFGNNFHPSDYMYLPKLNDYQPIILCNNDSDTESYDLIVLNNDKIISSLEIGIMDGESITQFTIYKDYKINLYKRKNTTEKNVFFKSYKIDKNGSIVEIK